MILLRRIASLIVVLALVASACSDSSGNIIGSVGDVDITEGDIGALYESDTLPIDEGLRQAIFALLAREVLVTGIEEDFGTAFDLEAVEVVYADLVTQMEGQNLVPADFLGIPDASLGMLRFNAEIGVIRQQAIDGLVGTPDVLATFFADPASYTTVCARHILVEAEETADDILGRLGDGEEFGALAAEFSLDSPTGDLPCSFAARYVDEFADATMTAPVGEFTGPVETTFGFHVIIVDERTAPTEAEFTADPLAFLSEDELNTLWGQWFNEKLGLAEVTLDPKFGEWTDVGILPPEAASGDE